ncbi:MAG: Phosphatidylinositol alpha-mannosyltransferase [Myxococcales bacterium]|nr:Phosphatidylinositol alpha-mannosyltransferase [Myxococcales bacterium]
MMVTYDLASPCGGVKHHAQQLAAALRRRGDYVKVVGPSSAAIKDAETHTFSGVVNVPANGSDNMLGIFVSPVSIAKFFRDNQFDVIHVHEPLQPSLSYWSVWMTRNIPHVATFHAYAEAEARSFLLARKAWAKTIFPWFQRGIAVSEPAARYAKPSWGRPLTIIPNGVPTDIFTPPPEHVTNGHVRLLFVGRIGDRRKGARFLFDAYRGLIERQLPVTLDVVGELGDAAPPPQLPGLRYHGPVGFERLTELYRSCDVFVAPSTGQESFGIVLLEAMASAKPVVCSDIDGYRQVAIPDGAFLVPPADAAALEERLAHVVQLDPATRARQGELNRRAAEGYDWDRLADRVRDEYVAAISVHGGGKSNGSNGAA